jgi:hypothetical protein
MCSGGSNVLIHAEEVVWIVLAFDGRRPRIIVAIGIFHAFVAFITEVVCSYASG